METIAMVDRPPPSFVTYSTTCRDRTRVGPPRLSPEEFDLHVELHEAIECLVRCEFVIKSLEGEVAARDERIATLEEKLVEMSLELATAKSLEDEHRLSLRRMSVSSINGSVYSNGSNSLLLRRSSSQRSRRPPHPKTHESSLLPPPPFKRVSSGKSSRKTRKNPQEAACVRGLSLGQLARDRAYRAAGSGRAFPSVVWPDDGREKEGPEPPPSSSAAESVTPRSIHRVKQERSDCPEGLDPASHERGKAQNSLGQRWLEDGWGAHESAPPSWSPQRNHETPDGPVAPRATRSEGSDPASQRRSFRASLRKSWDWVVRVNNSRDHGEEDRAESASSCAALASDDEPASDGACPEGLDPASEGGKARDSTGQRGPDDGWGANESALPSRSPPRKHETPDAPIAPPANRSEDPDHVSRLLASLRKSWDVSVHDLRYDSKEDLAKSSPSCATLASDDEAASDRACPRPCSWACLLSNTTTDATQRSSLGQFILRSSSLETEEGPPSGSRQATEGVWFPFAPDEALFGRDVGESKLDEAGSSPNETWLEFQ